MVKDNVAPAHQNTRTQPLKAEAVLPSETAQMNLGDVVRSEISQADRVGPRVPTGVKLRQDLAEAESKVVGDPRWR